MTKLIQIYVNFVSYLKTLPLIYKIFLIIFINSFFLYFSLTIIHMLYFSLFVVDLLFLIAFLRPIFFVFSSYFLTSFFSPCFIDLYNLKITLHSILFILCCILLLITFFHKSLKIRLLSSFTSFGIRLFIIGDITVINGISRGFMLAGGGIVVPYYPKIPSNFNFFDINNLPKRVPIRTEEGFVVNNLPQFFSSYTSQFYHDTYIKRSAPSFLKDINVIKNFKLNHGAPFTNLDNLHESLLQFFSLQAGDFTKDGFFSQIMRFAAPFPQDTDFLANLAQYNFNREDILLLTGLLDRFDMDVVKTFQRGYGWYDGTILVNNKRLTVDCYSPLSGQPNDTYLKRKLNNNIDLILMGNMKDNFNSYSTNRIIGVKGNSLNNIPIFRNINEEIEILIHDKNKPFIPSTEKGFTTFFDDFFKQNIKNK